MYFNSCATSDLTHTHQNVTFSFQSCSAVKSDCGALLWRTDVNALTLQFMVIENTGKKVLLLRGYTGMSAVLILLTITLYFQVSCNQSPHQLMGLSDSELLNPLVSTGTRLVAALLQHGPGFHLHFLFRQRSRYMCHSRSSSAALNALFSL